MFRNYTPYYQQQQNSQSSSYRSSYSPNGQLSPEDAPTVYRKPGQDYAANSFIGYHSSAQNLAAAAPAPPPPPFPYSSTWSLNRQVPTVSSSLGDSPGSYPLPSPLPSFKPPPSYLGYEARPPEMSSSSSRRGWKFCAILSLLTLVIAVLVAMAVAVYTQVRSQSSVIKLIRQYDASFLVTDGPLLDFSPQLMVKQSPQFSFKAQIFEQKIDSLLRQSGLAEVYEGSEVTGFKFVVAVPALEVQFLLKTKVDAHIPVQELLAVLHQGLESEVGHRIFGAEARVEGSSLMVEGEKLRSS